MSYLRCPICGLPLTAAEVGPGRALRCPRGHSFDIARQGYVNLGTGRVRHSGDTAAMVEARDAFLGAGHYDFLSATLADAARAVAAPGLVVDAGAGTGRHLAAVLDALPGAVGLALDVSKPALRRAARAHPRAAAAVSDSWTALPLADASAALVLNVFAPRNAAEFRRVLRPGGVLLVVTPAADHLAELVERLELLRVDPGKADRLAESLGERFDLVARRAHREPMRLSRTDIRTVVQMGPSAWHADAVTLNRRIADLAEPAMVTASISLGIYRPR